MKKLWHKNYTQSTFAEQYCFGDSAVLDTRLVTVDALGSIAHAQMLCAIGVLTAEEFEQLRKELLKIITLAEKGEFHIASSDEDVHTKIESVLTAKLGHLGMKIHTARSRNDQVVLDLRLFAKEELFTLSESLRELAIGFQKKALEYEFVPMPGYTHMQKAMPSSVGMWLGSFAESLIDDLELLRSAFILTDQSPLGAGAAYGVSLPIDREMTAQALGFAKVQNNSLYTQPARYKFQLAIMHGLTQVMLTLSRLAQDMLLFTTSEFNYFTIADNLTTGSSIMPQKRNLDVLEILRARTHKVIGAEQTAASMSAGLASGYNADFGETKELFMQSLDITRDSVNLCLLVVNSLKPNEHSLKKAMTSELYATHAAYLLVQKGVPFREAYKQVGLTLDQIPEYDALEVLQASNHIGGPGNLLLQNITKAIKEEQKWWEKKEAHYAAAIEGLKKADFRHTFRR